MGTINLISGWTTLWQAIPNSGAIGTVLSVIAVIIIIITVLPWLWQKRKGGMSGFGGFPWIAVVVAGLLAGPQLGFPVILGALSLIVNLLIAGANFVIHLFP